MKSSLRAFLSVSVALLVSASATHAQTLTRFRFTPPVVPENQVQPVRFEAVITGATSVAFNYNNVDRPMFDDGTNGDLVAGDGTWTILFTPSEILSKNTAARVFRPFIGLCKITGLGNFNIVAEVWTSAIGQRGIRPIDATGQETDFVVNYVATTAQLLTFVPQVWAQRFYATHGDKFDFLNFVLVHGRNGNRGHSSARNPVQGISTSTFDNTAQFGSAGRLLGYTVFPIPSFFDGGDAGFDHETGHQWINFLSGTSFASGIPHWPRGNVAINVMGFSIPNSGGVGGTYSFTFTPNGSGGFVVGPAQTINQSTFNSMELYLMGLAAPAEVASFFVLNDQNRNVVNGDTLNPSDITTVTVNDVIAARGPRVPSSVSSQKNFRSATIVISEQLLDVHAMSLYDFFARRSEAKQQLTFASGLATGTCNPWYLATGGRSVMFTRLRDEVPSVSISRQITAGSEVSTSPLTNTTTTLRALRTPITRHRLAAPRTVTSAAASQDSIVLDFIGKLGITYQAQSSSNFIQWTNVGAPVTTPLIVPAGDAPVSITVPAPAAGIGQMFYRVQVLY